MVERSGSMMTGDELARLVSRMQQRLTLVQDFAGLLRAQSEDERGLVERVQHLEQQLQAMARQVEQLEHLARRDPLTGLPNRTALEEELAREEARCRRFGTRAAVMLLDVVGLKAVNDRYGHLAGDELLRAVGRALHDTARASDVVGRWGGDEFLAILPGTDFAGAQAFLSRVRQALRAVRLPGGQVVSVDLAEGVATRDEAGSLAAALETADQRLVARKQAGRTLHP
jgi:diguanylate cyclase (GGDEF)-like protein